MLNKIIVDGYNMLHLVPSYREQIASDLEAARAQLIRDLQVYQAFKKVEITVVFDGSPDIPTAQQHQNLAGVQVIFSHAPSNADRLIMNLIRKEKTQKRLIVVSEDREIKNFALSAGSSVLSPQAFYQRLQLPSRDREYQNKFEHDLSPEELDEWKDIFGVD